MKKASVFVTFLAVIFLGFNLSAQTKIKLAHVNSNDLMMMMPGVDTARKAIEDYAKQLEEEMKAMYTEYEKKTTDFQNNQATMSQSLQQIKLKELQELQARIQSFEEQAQTELQTKQEELLKPLVDKAKAAIGEVAKENGYTYVFDSSLGVLLYSDESDNIIELVKKKLGIK
ncbi:MAG: OmpH family outer membrane protein [Bacteroidales bacterium]|jgi:outer membrane protein|nr:OmpH family outer membrane protein [Bacteroidales bacterium]